MVTKIYFVRHAQPNLDNHNDQERELTSQGLQDCQLVKQFFHDITIDKMFSSPYKRAYDTIKQLAHSRQLPIQVDKRFRERKITDEWIADFQAFSQQQWQDFSYRLDQGESLQEVQERVLAGLTEILQTCLDKTVLIASHGTAMSTLIAHYRPDFGYADFETIKNLMPFILELDFDKDTYLSITLYNLFTGETCQYL